jgi:hypothetical protein
MADNLSDIGDAIRRASEAFAEAITAVSKSIQSATKVSGDRECAVEELAADRPHEQGRRHHGDRTRLRSVRARGAPHHECGRWQRGESAVESDGGVGGKPAQGHKPSARRHGRLERLDAQTDRVGAQEPRRRYPRLAATVGT